MSPRHNLVAYVGLTIVVLLSATSAQATAYAQATISNITFSVTSLTGGVAYYSIKNDPSVVPTSIGATVYDLDSAAPGGYDSQSLYSYTIFDSVSTTATSNYNQATAASGEAFLTSQASSQDQLSAIAVAVTYFAGLEVSPYSKLLITYDITVLAKDDGLAIPPNDIMPAWQQRPYESAIAYAGLDFYGADGAFGTEGFYDYFFDANDSFQATWYSSGSQLIGIGTNTDGNPENVVQSGHYSSWVTNLTDAPQDVALYVRTQAESYGGGISPVPEAEIYVLFLVGLSLLGFISFRRKTVLSIN